MKTPSQPLAARNTTDQRSVRARPTAHLSEPSWVRLSARVGAGAIGFPLAILLHELGHLSAFFAFGFEGLVLQHTSVAWDGRQEFWHLIQIGEAAGTAAISPAWQVAVAMSAGPAVTYLTVIACALLAHRFGPSALVLAVGLAAPLRSVAVLPSIAHKLLGQELTTGFDENRVATLTNTPEVLLLFVAAAFLVGGWWLLVRAVPVGERRKRLGPVLAGMSVGGPAWLLWLGPWLLP